MGPITTKDEFLRLSEAGQLGNRMPSWPTVAAAQADGYFGPVMIRDKTPNSPHMTPNVEQDDVPAVIARLAAAGANPDRLYLTWMSPEVGRLLNAEVWDGPGGPHLHYSPAQLNVRAALDTDGRHASGAAARAILRSCLCPNSWDDLWTLFDLYPDHAIELTAYERPIGSIPNRNTVIWEVRRY